jgi:hypothetical protein
LSNGGLALVDDDDYGKLSQYRWRKISGGNDIFYAITTIKGETKRMHRMIMGALPELRVDHINGNGLDNQRQNLRFATVKENIWASRISKNNTSGHIGVTKARSRFRARIDHQGRRRSIGCYSTLDDAARAYNLVCYRLRAAYARLNAVFPAFPSEAEVDRLDKLIAGWK